MESKETHGSVGGASTSSSSSTTKKKQSKRPKYSRFSQQELPACKFIITPTVVISTFVAIAIVFIPLGLASLFASDHVVEITHRYDNLCLPESSNAVKHIQNKDTNKTCAGKLTIPKEMKGPIFIYYQLDNFYQNHRRYVKSRSDKQLKSKSSAGDTESCAPEANTDKGPIVPCGLVAWSLFNDTYKFVVKNKVVDVNKKNIAWESDKSHKFGSDVYPQNFQSGGLIGGAKLEQNKPLSEQEDLIVWMRTAALPTFRKLYGRIEGDLQVNDNIELVVENNYNTYSYGGKKWLILSTTSWIGGKNEFLGIAYLTIGGLCLFLAVTFILIYVLRPRQLGDPSYLSWNKQPREP
ncbi:ALA-interacting subunit 1 [Linum grandiflorum]